MEWGDAEANWKGNLRVKPAFSINIIKEINSIVEIRAATMLGALRGYQPTHNRDFKADLFDVNLSASIDFTRISFGLNACRPIEVHGMFGIGFLDYSSILRNISRDSILYTTGYDNKGNYTGFKTTPVVMTGISVKFRLSRQVYIVFNNTWTVTNTDYIDGYKGGFSHDIYSYTSLGLMYRFNLRSLGKAFPGCNSASMDY